MSERTLEDVKRTLLDVPRPAEERRDLKSLLASYERALILTALAASGGHQRRAAASLGILPTTLHEKMKRLGLKPRSSPAEVDAPESGGPDSEARLSETAR